MDADAFLEIGGLAREQIRDNKFKFKEVFIMSDYSVCVGSDGVNEDANAPAGGDCGPG